MNKIITSVGIAVCLFASTATFAQTAKYAGAQHFTLPESMQEDVDYMKGHIIFKVKDQYRSKCTVGYINDAQLTTAINYLNVNTFGKIYPNHQPPAEKKNSLGQAYADLSLIYELTYKNTSVSLEKAINILLSTGLFEFAEPRYQYAVDAFVPNDAGISNQQSYLTAIKAYVTSGFGGAWDTSDPLIGPAGAGDTNVVVGIVDSGSDPNHPDLVNQLKHNYADPIGGGDNDGDGYTDNFNGWDLAGSDYNNIVGDNNTDVTGSNNNHGSHVSGCASAQVDNSIGAAGTGRDCKFLPVKCAADNDTRSNGSGYIITGYEGITYAADHGAKVINCSWGGAGGGSYGQTIINYASINKNSIVVAAAGNNGADQAFFPAAYNYVLNVAATSSTNNWLTKASFSNYNFAVDISAPGNNIYNTVWNNTYTSMSGTSMASPVCAGGVALVLAKFPTYTGLQAGQRIMVTSDAINAANPSYQNKLGAGRINLYKALTNPASPSVVFTNQLVSDHNDLAFAQGDTLFISGDFINYLSPTSSAATATISVYSGGTLVSLVGSNSFPLGVIATNSSVNNNASPYRYRITTATQNASVTFRVTIVDGTYSQSYFVPVLLNPDYVNVAVNDVATTITSKGKIGWNADGASTGLGFTYMGSQLLYEGGLMIGSSSTKVSDCVRGTTAGTSDADFANLVVAQKTGPTVSDFDVYTRFNDASASPVQNITTRQKAYAWTSAGSRKFVICEYVLVNTGSTAFTNGYAGIFADWDIDDATYAQNKSDYDFTRKMGYSWYTNTGGKFAGIKLLTTTANANFYGIDNAGTGRGGVNITSAYSTASKYTTLSTFRQKAGDSTWTGYLGNDVCNVMSTGSFSIAAGDSIKIAFALIAGDDLADLQESADTAQVRWDGIGTTGISSHSALQNFVVYPNPAADAINFVFGSNQLDNFTISLFNVIGEEVKATRVNAPGAGFHNATLDVSDLAPGTYIYKVTDKAGKVNMGKIIVKH